MSRKNDLKSELKSINDALHQCELERKGLGPMTSPATIKRIQAFELKRDSILAQMKDIDSLGTAQQDTPVSTSPVGESRSDKSRSRVDETNDSSFLVTKRKTLESRLKALLGEYEAASNQWSSALGEADRLRLRRQMDGLEAQILGLEEELSRYETMTPQKSEKPKVQEASVRPLRVFLSHASEDKPQVRKVYGKLMELGIDAWLDEEELLPGQDWQLEIRRAVRRADIALVFLSKKAVTKAGYVQKELKQALDVADEQPEGAIFLIPVRLEECQVPDRLRHLHWVDLYEDQGWDLLLPALEKRAAEQEGVTQQEQKSILQNDELVTTRELKFPVAITSTKGDIRNADLRREINEVAVCRSVPDVVYAVIDKTMFVSRDGAQTWTDLSFSAGRITVDHKDPATVYALLSNGLRVSNDYGNRWRLVSSVPQFSHFSSGEIEVHPTDSSILVMSNASDIDISHDKGVNWRHYSTGNESSFPAKCWFAVEEHREGVIVAATYESSLHYSNDYGESWKILEPPPTGAKLHPGISRPVALDPGSVDIWYADLGTHNVHEREQFPRGVFVTPDFGETWHLVSDGDTLRPSIDQIVFVAAGDQYVIYIASPSSGYYSFDRGSHWYDMSVPYQESPNDLAEISPFSGMLVNGCTGDGLVYMKTRSGLLKSVDNGSTWFY